MADEKLVEMLKSDGGVERFNAWRRENMITTVDLKKAVFKNAHLEGANLYGADLTEADFSGAHLEEADFSCSNLSKADFNSAQAKNADFAEAHLTNADLTLAKLDGAQFGGADVVDANFEHADLRKVYLAGAYGLERARFYCARLEPKAQAVILAAISESFVDPADDEED